MSGYGMLSLGCLVVTCLASTWGIFSIHFDDNLLQRAGLAIVATGTAARAFERMTQDVPDPLPALLWSQVGIAAYAIGTIVRFWLAARQHPNRRKSTGRRGLHA